MRREPAIVSRCASGTRRNEMNRFTFFSRYRRFQAESPVTIQELLRRCAMFAIAFHNESERRRSERKENEVGNECIPSSASPAVASEKPLLPSVRFAAGRKEIET